MKSTLIAFVALIATWSSYAQQDSSSNVSYKNDIIVKMDFANTLNPFDPSVLISGEYFFRENTSFTQEIGYVIYSHFEDKNEEISGWKLRQELRIYPDISQNAIPFTYLSFNVSYRRLAMDGNYMLGFGCDDGACDYYQNFTKGKVAAHRLAIFSRLGFFKPIGEKWILEWDYGLGFQYVSETKSSFTRTGELLRAPSIYDNHYSGWSPYMAFSVKVGYTFKR